MSIKNNLETKIIGKVIGGLLLLAMASQSFYSVELGVVAVYQNKLTGESSVDIGPTFGFRIPIMSKITEYKEITTVVFEQDAQDVSVAEKPISVRFSDTYNAQIPVSARINMPTSEIEILKIHKAFRNFNNLTNTLYEKTLRDVVVNSAIHYTAEEFFQGALNEFKGSIIDAANNGLIKTERVQVLVKSKVGVPSELGAEKSSTNIRSGQEIIWKVQPKLDADGKQTRNPNPFAQYGITVSQVNIGNPVPEIGLEKLLATKKRLVAEKISMEQRQSNARAEAETAKLEGETARVKAEQEMKKISDAAIIKAKKEVALAGKLLEKETIDKDREKQKAIIDKEKEVEVAKLQAEKEKIDKEKEKMLAVITKQKELEIARANEGIQAANYIASKHEALAIKEVGLARAAVRKAMYGAYIESIYAKEIDKSINEYKYGAYKDTIIEMPKNVMITGGNTGGNINDLTSAVLFEKLSSPGNVVFSTEKNPNKKIENMDSVR